MPLPQDDPSLPGGAAPLFSDTDAARGDHLRANNQKIWEDLEYLNAGENINDAAAAAPVNADRLGFWQIAGAIIKYVTFSNLWAYILAKIVSTGAGTPVGTYIQHAGAAAPTGFLACDGSSLLRAGTYADLFAVIGTTYGAADGTHFTLPDARGLVMVGAGAHGTMTRANGAAYDGGTVGTSRDDQTQGHKHNSQDTGLNAAYYGTTPLFTGGGDGSTLLTSLKTSTPISDGANGTPRTGNETRPAEIAVLVCIKF